jgi:hypothetical protein
MPVTATPIFAQAPYMACTTLAVQTACTTRGPTVTANLAAANIIQIVPTSTNGLRIDSIQVNACSTAFTSATAGNIVGIWVWDGTTAFLFTEILVTAITPSTTVAGFTTTLTFANPLVLPSTFKLYASVSVTTTASTTALQVSVMGGSY